VTAVDENGEEQCYQARFYVDATGRDTFLANLLGIKQRSRKHASAALYGHFAGAKRNSGVDEGNIAIYWFDHGWFWFIPLKDGVTSVGAVCAPAYLKRRQASVEAFFQDTIAQCPGIQERLSEARLVSPATATGNYSYESSRMHGKNYLMVGDAFAFIDPVFSSGVHLALHGAFRGAELVDRILDQPDCAAREFRNYQKEIVGGLRTFSWLIYRSTSPAVRDMFIHPRNVFGVRPGMVSLLAGDVFRDTPLRIRLMVFKVIYYLMTLFSFKESRAAWRRRQNDMGLN
jgi:flavin-dependent dehydrogenase